MDFSEIIVLILKLIEHLMLDEIKKHKKAEYTVYKNNLINKLKKVHENEVARIDDKIEMQNQNIQSVKEVGGNTSRFDNIIKKLNDEKEAHKKVIASLDKLQKDNE